MVYLFGFFQFIILVAICLYEFRQKSSVVFMWVTLLIMFGMMHLLSSFVGDSTYANHVLIEASVFVLLFCCIYFITRFVLANKVLRENRAKFTYVNIQNHYLKRKMDDWFIVFLTIVVILKVYPYIGNVNSVLLTSWSNIYAYKTSLEYVNSNSIFSIIFYSLSGLVLAYLVQRKFFLCGIAGIILLVNVILTRNRIEILPLLCSIITFFIIKNNKIKFKTILLATVGAIGIVYFIYGIRVYRHYGTIQNFVNQFEVLDFVKKINNYIATDNGELGLRRYFYDFVANRNKFSDFGKGHSYLRMLLVYIPTRWSLGIKPEDFALTMGKAVGMKVGVSIHPTLFGDCYANLGFFGVFIGAFWAVYSTTIDKMIIRQKNTTTMMFLYTLNAVAYVIIGRGSVYNGFWIVAFGMPLILVCSFIFGKYSKIKIRIYH